MTETFDCDTIRTVSGNCNIIEKTLKENILDKSAAFVFNTNVAASSWTDFIVRQDGKDGWPATVAQSRFLAWDAFKGQALKSKEEGKQAVPALLRKLFARSLLERIKGGENFFERLINSEYKENALSFTDWLSGILPSLGRWRILADKFIVGEKPQGERDNAENRDYLKLYNEYSRFLDERGLFEPSWKNSRFDSQSKKNYIVFFPELLDDFDEYAEVLAEAQKEGRVRLVKLPELKEEIRADYWQSMRLELRMTALKILRERAAGTDWSDIALCVPDIENLRPYIERELSLYQIPFVTRSGIKLGKTGAGRIFRKIQDCVQSKFSYQSVRSLALDANIPWKSADEMELLVRLGKEAKCLVQYTGSDGLPVDPWISDLSEGVKKSADADEFLNAKKFYKSLKSAATALAEAPSFAKIKKAWTEFESAFLLEKEKIDDSSNKILSRAVALLDELCAIEKRFPEILKGKIERYAFFLNEIEGSQYQWQSKRLGISVFDYKVSAQAAIKKQFVINASQEAVTVETLPLKFLSQKERDALLKEKDDGAQSDHSEAYVRSYAICSGAAFSASQKALDGFAIPHSALAAGEKPRGPDSDLDAADFIKAQKDFLADNGACKNESGLCLTQAQKDSFEKYFSRAEQNESGAAQGGLEKKEFLSAAIERKTKIERGQNDGRQDRIHITATELGDFYPCPRKWIFKDLLRVDEFSLDTDLFEVYDQGSVNHKILELYFESLKQKGEPLPVTDSESGKLASNENFLQEEEILLPALEKFSRDAFEKAKAYKKSALVQEALKSQDKIFAREVLKFLREFCKKEAYGGWKVEETEWGFGKDVDLPPILQGRMDLLLRSPDGAIAIIDYKNSSWAIPSGDLNLKKGEGELDDCQMAAYVRLWENDRQKESDKVSRASFVPIKNFKETKVIAPVLKGNTKAVVREDFDGALQSLGRLAAGMEKALEKKEFSQEKVKPYKDCVSCSFNSICRTVY